MHIRKRTLNYITFNKATHTKSDENFNNISLLHLFFYRCPLCSPMGPCYSWQARLQKYYIRFTQLQIPFRS
jgi:hypothetical protein